MIQQVANIQCQFCGLIPHMIVAHRLFDGDEQSAIEYLDSLVENGLLKYLNGQYPENQYYRLIGDHDVNCDICPEDGCINVING